MKQVFLISPAAREIDLEAEDALPVSERLISELGARFQGIQSEDRSLYSIPAAQAAEFLRQFYSRYELSQPQRRVWRRLEQALCGLSPDQNAEFVVTEVSAHRSRRKSKKI